MISLSDQINEARSKNQLLHVKNVFKSLPSWQDFINNLNYKYNSNKESDYYDKRFLKKDNKETDVLIYNSLDIQVMHAVSKDYQTNFLFQNKDIIKELENISGFSFGNIKTLINFIKDESEYFVHSDNHDVMLIQCQGNIEWRIYNSLDSKNYDSYIIEPGDLVFAPSGVFHQVVISEPRATIILDHNYVV